ncbi:WSC domain-containing protein [Rhypophila decipiens]|uniref:WSC domain-containing protein n=1 Tax=Rhypophila decipiens TaxID=261697 RepID=A0AAN6XVZ3_9PEZI|nr:WSC domain-containing protein [Rhypophila decipiens]
MASTRSGLFVSLLLTGYGASTVSSLPSRCTNTLNRRAPGDAAVPAFSPLGCYTDNEGGGRALSDSQTASDDMTVEKCATFCSRYNVFGVEYGRECYCGTIKAESSREVDASECSFPCAGDAAQKCGAGNRLNLFTLAAPVVRGPATLVGATSLGCFVDGEPRVLPYNIIGADDMTAAKCAAHCEGYDYFGTQYSRECYCGTSAPAQAAPASECSMPCAGNADELCGAGMRLNVYKFDEDEDEDCDCDEEDPEDPESPVPGFDYQGCFTDNVPHRVLSAAVFSDPQMTPSKCAASCTVAGFTWSGTQYGAECYCGNELNPASTKVAESECSMPCGGDTTLKCGASNRLSIYTAEGVVIPGPANNLDTIGEFRYASCYADNLEHRVLEAVDYRTADMTIEKCAARCEAYLYFGLQFGNECYCGDELRGGQVLAETDCGMLCVGDKTQLCGGPARLNLYTRAAAVISSSVVASSVQVPSSSVVSSNSASAVIPSSSIPASSSVAAPSSFAPSSSVAASSSVAPPSSVAASSSAAPASSASLSIPAPSSVIASSSHLSSSIPSSTSTTPKTTAGPVMTTITTCPSSSTVDNGYGCFASGYSPSYCTTLTGLSNSRALSSMITACRRSMTTWGNTAAPYTSCFPGSVAANPANLAVAQATAQSVFSCLQNSGAVCTYASSCTTNTYEATAVPTSTPTLDVGVNLLQNPSFELGDSPANSNWTFSSNSGNIPATIVSSTSRSGSRAYQATYRNINGAALENTQVVRNLQPLHTYYATVFYMHTNSAASTYFRLEVNPGGFTIEHSLQSRAPNTWHEITLEFTAFTNWLEFKFVPRGIVLGNTGTPGGVDVIYADDAWLSRR